MQNLIKTILVLLLPLASFGQINFYKHFANDGSDFARGVVQLEDSSYVVCGSSSSFSTSHSQAFLMKLDSTGNYIWSNDYGGFESESAERVLYQQGYGFLIAGFTNSFGYGGYDCYMAKVSENGIMEWETSYGGPGWDRVNDAALTRDTGAILVGETNLGTGSDWFIVRTDKNGDTLWTKTMGGNGEDVANCIETYQDSLFVIGGSVYLEDSLMTKALFMFIDEDGNILDQDTIGYSGSYTLNDITISNDTIHGIGGHNLTSADQSNAPVYSMVISGTQLNPLGHYVVAVTGNFVGELITVYGTGSHRYTASTNSDEVNVYAPGRDIVVSKFTYWLGWSSNFIHIAKEFDDVPGQFIPTSDGGAMLVGYRVGIGPGEGAVFVLKIGKDEVYPVVSDLVLVEQLVAIEELNSMIEASLYPNPASQSFTVELKDNNEYDIVLMNSVGQTVQSNHIFGSETIDVSTLATGFYTVLIQDESNNLGSYRLVIQ